MSPISSASAFWSSPADCRRIFVLRDFRGFGVRGARGDSVDRGASTLASRACRREWIKTAGAVLAREAHAVVEGDEDIVGAISSTRKRPCDSIVASMSGEFEDNGFLNSPCLPARPRPRRRGRDHHKRAALRNVARGGAPRRASAPRRGLFQPRRACVPPQLP